LTGIVAATWSRTRSVSGKCSPVSRKTTSTPGNTRDTTWISTASANELVTQNRSPNVSAAHRTMSSARAPSSRWPASVASSRSSSAERPEAVGS
jgi:hypothetical protein